MAGLGTLGFFPPVDSSVSTRGARPGARTASSRSCAARTSAASRTLSLVYGCRRGRSCSSCDDNVADGGASGTRLSTVTFRLAEDNGCLRPHRRAVPIWIHSFPLSCINLIDTGRSEAFCLQARIYSNRNSQTVKNTLRSAVSTTFHVSIFVATESFDNNSEPIQHRTVTLDSRHRLRSQDFSSFAQGVRLGSHSNVVTCW